MIEGMEMRERLKASGVLAALSVLWAVGSLRPDLLPPSGMVELAAPVRQAVLFALFAASCAVLAMWWRRPSVPKRQLGAWAVVGIALFVVPTGLVAAASGWISDLERVAIFCLTPVFAVVLEPHLQPEGPVQGRGALVASLTAVGGALCIFPLDVPGSIRTVLAVLVLLLAALWLAAANCVAVRMACLLPAETLAPAAALAGAVAATCFAVDACATHAAWNWSALVCELPWMLLVDLPALLALFWLLRRLSAARMTGRFLLAPLFTALGGIVLERPALTARGWLGLALLAAGAGWLLLAPPADAAETKSLLQS